MNVMIARPGELFQRVFPPIGPDLYSTGADPADLTPDQQAARNLLALANKEFTTWERFLGWKLGAPGRIGRVLLHHRLAMAAELEAQWQRADFFWNEVHKVIKSVCEQPEVWAALVEVVAKESGVAIMNDPEQLRRHLVEEIFIDTHCAFYNGRVQQIEKRDPEYRAFVHINYIKRLIDSLALPADEYLAVLNPPAELIVKLYQEAKQWDQAIEVCTDMLNRYPHLVDYQDRLASLHFTKTQTKLNNGKSESQNLQDAKTLQATITILEGLRKKYPHNVTIFEILGHLHHLCAVKLANGKRLSDALVEVQKALMFNPYLEAAKETRTTLGDMMRNLQAQVAVLKAQLAKRPNATLSEEGRRMQYEAQRGFKPLEEYNRSPEAEETASGFQLAYARRVWQDIGLAEPENRWDERARMLLNALSIIISNPPADKDDLARAWVAVAAQHANLTELDAVRICAFLEHRLFGAADETPVTKTAASPSGAPALTATATNHRQAGEPFGYWFFSRQGIRIKLQAAIAIVLLLVAGGFAISESLNRRARDTAYHQILEAAGNQDYLSVIEGTEVFFSNPILSGKDGRENQVKKLYDEALVRWFVTQRGEPDADTQAHIERYRKLIVDSK